MAKPIIAVDLGGTNLRLGVVKNGKIIEYVKKSTPKKKEELLKEFECSIQELLNKYKRIKGIGVSSPGPLLDGIIKNPPNLPLRNFNLKKFLEKKFNKRVVVENDAKCVAIAESRLGCKKKDFIILTLGTGIGGGIIFNGEIYKGQGYAGEVGHIILDDGKDFETLLKDNRAKCKGEFGDNILIKDLLKMKNEKAKQLLEELCIYLGQGIGSLIDVFDPEIIVISGGVRETGNIFLSMIKKQVEKYTLIPRIPPIVWSKLEHPNLLGASLLIK